MSSATNPQDTPLRELEHIYRTAPVGLSFLDSNLVFVRVNERLAKMNGKLVSEHLGRPLRDVVPEVAAFTEPIMRRVMETGKPVFDSEISGPDPARPGAIGVWLTSFFPVMEGSVLQGVSCIVLDITERKRAAEERERLGRMLEDSLNEIYVFDAGTLHFVEVNRSARENLGYSMEELRALTPVDLKPEFTEETFARLIAPIRAGMQEKLDFMTLHRRRDGSTYPVEVRLHVCDFGSRAFIAIVVDITERKRAEMALRESENRYREIAEDTPVLICRFLPGGEITYVNKAYCEYFTTTSEQLVGSSFLSLIPEENRKTVLANISALAVDSPTQSHEHRVIAPGDEIRWQRWTNRALFDDQGNVIAYQSVGEDITERKRTEERVRFLSMITEQVSDSVIVTNRNYEITYVNRSFQSVYGYSAEEVLGRSPGLLNAESRSEEIQSDIYRTVSSGQTWRGELLNRRKNGEVFPCELTVYPLIDEQGSTFAYVGIQRDITARKSAEDALRVADRLSAMGTMVAGVAHEINSPLTTILGLSELMAKNSALPADARQHANEIVAQAVRAAKIVDDLLGLARIGRISHDTVQINSLIQRSLNHLRDSHRFDGVEIVEDYDGDLPETWADPYRLEQVFVNIIRNAGDALREATALRRLTIRTERCGDQIRVRFTDTGHGVETPAKVFDPFYTTKDHGEGAGLGLSVSLGIIRDHGGDITLETFDESTQFLVTLPVRSDPESASS